MNLWGAPDPPLVLREVLGRQRDFYHGPASGLVRGQGLREDAEQGAGPWEEEKG